MNKVISRLAPSPTGYLHLGNAWSFVICWLLTRSLQGELILRIDDLDPERSKEDFTKNIIADLKWLGLDWDRGPDQANGFLYYQSNRHALYAEALERLEAKGRVYPCFCSRKELRLLASAPHASGSAVQNCPCRDKSAEEINVELKKQNPYSYKFRTEQKSCVIKDLVYGAMDCGHERWGGDFALRRSDGVFAYQLASALDDAQMGVNLVVRGNDLLESAGRQIEILNTLGYSPPLYAHLPLLLDHKGERLAKRHASLSLTSFRKQGVKAEQIIGLFAYWAKIQASPAPCSLQTALQNFTLEKMSTLNILVPEILPFNRWRV